MHRSSGLGGAAAIHSPVYAPLIENAKSMSAASIARLEAIAYRYGRSFDSYLVMDLDRLCFWSSCGRAVLGFVVKGAHAVVIGGLMGPDDAREVLLTEFMGHCGRLGWTACFGLVDERDVPMFDRLGFQSTKIGEDALIDLRECTWRGKAYEWVRRQTNYCHRQGLECRELSPATMAPLEWRARAAELAQISEEFLHRSPHGHAMRYFVGQFDPDRLHRRRVFAGLAGEGAGRIEGYVVCAPYRDGRAWAIEMYRSRADGVRGTVPFLMHSAMRILKAEGATEVSLCLMPGAHCSVRRPGDSWVIHSYIRLTHHYLNFIFDTPGIFHFKSRFRPVCASRYCSVWPKASVGPLHAILDTWGTIHFSPWRALARGVRRIRIHRQRATLVRS